MCWRLRRAQPASGVGVKSATIETVFMPSENRQTICISTQAGCAVDCRFCLTATLGLIRNLSAGEIVGQVLVALEDNRDALKPQTNIVLMGQGEPLLNYDAVMARCASCSIPTASPFRRSTSRFPPAASSQASSGLRRKKCGRSWPFR